jgi:phage FluMu protein Com
MARDVMTTGLYLKLFGPSYVYVKYRCSRCKKLGEDFVKQEEWDSGILRNVTEEVRAEEKVRYESLGPIDINEVIDFHFQLENGNTLKDLMASPPVGKKVKQKSSTDR